MENQTTQTPETQEQQITVGFAKALNQFVPEWRATMTSDEVNRYRYFYAQGVQDVALVAQLQHQSLAQNLQAIRQTIAVTGNEEDIARLQAEQAATQAEDEESNQRLNEQVQADVDNLAAQAAECQDDCEPAAAVDESAPAASFDPVVQA